MQTQTADQIAIRAGLKAALTSKDVPALNAIVRLMTRRGHDVPSVVDAAASALGLEGTPWDLLGVAESLMGADIDGGRLHAYMAGMSDFAIALFGDAAKALGYSVRFEYGRDELTVRGSNGCKLRVWTCLSYGTPWPAYQVDTDPIDWDEERDYLIGGSAEESDRLLMEALACLD